MSEIVTVGLVLVKNVFQLHGADASERVVMPRKLWRGQVVEFFAGLGRVANSVEIPWQRAPGM